MNPVLANPKRGGGHLKKGALYLHSDLSAEGTLPPFVWFDPALPYPEQHFRGWKIWNGLSLEIVAQPPTRLPWEIEQCVAYVNDYNTRWLEDHVTQAGSVERIRHIQRLSLDDASALSGWGEKSVARFPQGDAFDLLMWVGESYYATPELFVDEVLQHGLNKRISFTTPPKVIPGRTKLYLAHPNAILDKGDGDSGEEVRGPAIFGYCYLTTVVFTLPSKTRDIPAVALDWQKLGKVEFYNLAPETDEEDGQSDLFSGGASPMKRFVAKVAGVVRKISAGEEDDEA